VFEKRRHIPVPHHRLLKNGFFISLLNKSFCRHASVTAMDGGNTENAGAVFSESWHPGIQ
jgi:hypothetical protein